MDPISCHRVVSNHARAIITESSSVDVTPSTTMKKQYKGPDARGVWTLENKIMSRTVLSTAYSRNITLRCPWCIPSRQGTVRCREHLYKKYHKSSKDKEAPNLNLPNGAELSGVHLKGLAFQDELRFVAKAQRQGKQPHRVG